MASRLNILPWMVLAVAAAGPLITSCDDDKRSYVPNIGNGDTVPTLTTTNVKTYVSDSGYTRFFIESDLWEMYEDAAEPFWLFPNGLDLEEYDRDMQVIANVSCDSARYLSQKRIWRLRGNVVMVNTLGDSFLTQLMFWDQNKREVYSDSFVHIVRQGRIIEGYGFQSNENITEYRILRPTGIIPNADLMADEDKTSEEESVSDERRNRRMPPPPRQRTDENGILMHTY